ncbi:alkyl/aryl-sulfatase BDS1, putative [Entamoeba invadens IP1]|uniref:Alkyl/aryl-sulfatase BDS1, putative n=1 Tax=Entamoeba invadens IP1 TaxID=370355 RepID=A0A0A1TW37_ENTIV|nr:alkyl/aryl-sulfatase BDS1, putative [Entamoeba invadens IP1]ELP84744.1 alkyl/aryl-sulfatase BDS1, putative [Entamoeba invadens IP1]|eukprot:XP_004184090.1 alkyl/aryl-sulfatase BDS1, putative [Entamoeba invadens IP1]
MACDFVKQHNTKVLSELDFTDKQDYADASHGFMCTIEGGAISNNKGGEVFNFHDTDFLEKECPETVNPSLWRQCQLNRIHGLFEVIPHKVYQFRGFDIANMTFVRGEKGWVVIDTLCCLESAAAGIQLVRDKVADLPVTAVLLTHSHGDHIKGLNSVLEENTEVYIPKDFFKVMVSENLLAGVAMERRCVYMFGSNLEKSPKGWVGCGLGTESGAGQISTFAPKHYVEIVEDTTKIVDGITIDFMYTPNAEAPTEMMMYFPELKAICTAEEINRLQHNLYTLRGAQVRNGKDWSKYIDNILVRYADKLDYSFGTHNWPTFGNENIVKYYEKQRDLYKYIHDQTLRQVNLGTTLNELPEKVVLPKSLSSVFYNRDYYGTVSHNCRAQCQYYLGFYDANPANLNPLTPVNLGTKYVEAIGGEERCITIAEDSFKNGEYQWAITLLNNVVFKNPRNEKARYLLADIYTQTAYMQESAVWRNCYLTAAFELRLKSGNEEQFNGESNVNDRILLKLPIAYLFDVFAVSLDPTPVEGIDLSFNITFTDTKENGYLLLKNSVLNNRSALVANCVTTVKCTKSDLVNLILNRISKETFLKQNEATGNIEDFFTLLNSIKIATPKFAVVEP